MFWKKDIISLDRPIIVKGKILKDKLEEKIDKINKEIEEFNKILVDQYDKVVEGTIKSEQKKVIQKQVGDLQLQKIWLKKLYDSIDQKREYALNLTEATTLNIIASVSDD